MSVGIIFLLLLAALTHAVWNAMVKGAHDSVAMATWAYGGGAILAAPFLFFLPALPWEGWVLVGLHSFLHGIYKILLLRMYRLGDFSQVFPVTRGVASLLTTLAAILVVGEILPTQSLTGVVIIALGLIVFALEPGALRREACLPLLLAVGAGGVVTAYTVVDALGVRLEGAGYTYFAWLLVVDGIGMLALGLWWRGRGIWPLMGAIKWTGISVAVLSTLNFGIVMWAISFNPIGLVVAIRETSIVMAAIIGTVFFREAFGFRRLLAAAIVLAGVALISFEP